MEHFTGRRSRVTKWYNGQTASADLLSVALSNILIARRLWKIEEIIINYCDFLGISFIVQTPLIHSLTNYVLETAAEQLQSKLH